MLLRYEGNGLGGPAAPCRLLKIASLLVCVLKKHAHGIVLCAFAQSDQGWD